ncbi:MAG: TRAP transporter substrate-binding protein DctP [Gemmatimonadota bacterium]|nr:MAG: TRAP transporter substrate-binding protein DctP [Gemmatimonadota bacterium]
MGRQRRWFAWTSVLAVLCLSIGATENASAQSRMRVKLATLAPDGSPWHRILEDMGHEWQEATAGRVRLVIYPGGVAGDDQATLRKIRHGQLQAATLTVSGLAELDDAFNVFQIPLFFESIEEFFYVLDRLTPTLKERLGAHGLVVLHWGYGGWLHFFSKSPTRTVSDLKRLKMYAGTGDDRLVRLWRANGYNPVALSATDIMVGLQSGMIDGLPAPPLGALAFQWYRQTPYMLHPGFAPLVGATVIAEEAWEQLTERDQSALLEAARVAGERLAVEIPRRDEESLAEMEMRGLQVIRVEVGDDADPWRAAAESFAESFRTTMVPGDVLDLALQHRARYRREEAPAAASSPP